jgi:adenylate cyclase
VTVEIERKYLVDPVPGADLLAAAPSSHLRQGYLAEDGDVTVRVRIADEGATLTVKAGRGVSRTEVEVEIEPADADALWPHTVGARIEKVRHRLPLPDVPGGPQRLVAEVDVYAGDLEGLCTVEVEFADLSDAQGFVAPDWFGRELTDEPGWTNAELARSGRPDT